MIKQPADIFSVSLFWFVMQLQCPLNCCGPIRGFSFCFAIKSAWGRVPTSWSRNKKLKAPLTYQPRTFAGIAKWLTCGFFLVATLPLQAATFNVTNYGAAGNDRTDNTAAFTACINAIIAAGGGRMFLPNGVYRGRITMREAFARSSNAATVRSIMVPSL